jgi:hypothetical protein
VLCTNGGVGYVFLSHNFQASTYVFLYRFIGKLEECSLVTCVSLILGALSSVVKVLGIKLTAHLQLMLRCIELYVNSQ